MRLFGAIEKYDSQDDGSVLIAGIASSELQDSQGEIISADAMRKALPEWMAWGNIREQHSRNAVGKAISADVNPDGKTRISAKIVDTEAVKKIKAGIYKGFSIAGECLSKMANVVTRLSLSEISICDRPVNPECVFSIWKAEKPQPEITKSMDSKLFAKALKLPETATEQEIIDAIVKATATPPAPAATAPTIEAIQSTIEKAIKAATDPLSSKLVALEARASQDAKTIEKAEKKTLIDQASREGKIVPLTDAEIYGEGDKPGVSVDLLKSMIGKLQKSVPLAPAARFKVKDVEKSVEELTVEERTQLCKSAKANAAVEIGRLMKADPNARFLPAQN